LEKWQVDNFGPANSKDMALGMAEEVGELCHYILKRDQRIREGSNGEDCKAQIGDAFADAVIFGIQLMTCEGIDAEKVLLQTIDKVLKRNWKINPSGNGMD